MLGFGPTAGLPLADDGAVSSGGGVAPTPIRRIKSASVTAGSQLGAQIIGGR